MVVGCFLLGCCVFGFFFITLHSLGVLFCGVV
jgi:hypothetical protein